MNNKVILIILIVAVVIFGFILLTPNKEQHEDAIAEKVALIIHSDSVASSDVKMIDDATLKKVIKASSETMLVYDNYYLLSIGSISFNNEKRVVSIGILHHVFCLFGKEDLEGMNNSGDAVMNEGE